MKRKLVFVAVVLLAAMSSINAQQGSSNSGSEIRESVKISSIQSDASGETKIDYVEGGHRYRIRLNGKQITEIYKDDTRLAESEFAKYEPLVKQILERLEKDRKRAEEDRARAAVDREQAQKDRAQAEKDRQRAQEDRDRANKDRERAERDREQAQRDREQAVKDRAQAEKDRQQAAKDRERAEEDRKVFEGMLDELVKDKIVEDRASLTELELDKDKLVINGKEQPSAVHERYWKKYGKGTGSRIHYRNSGSSRNFSFN